MLSRLDRKKNSAQLPEWQEHGLIFFMYVYGFSAEHLIGKLTNSNTWDPKWSESQRVPICGHEEVDISCHTPAPFLSGLRAP